MNISGITFQEPTTGSSAPATAVNGQSGSTSSSPSSSSNTAQSSNSGTATATRSDPDSSTSTPENGGTGNTNPAPPTNDGEDGTYSPTASSGASNPETTDGAPQSASPQPAASTAPSGTPESAQADQQSAQPSSAQPDNTPSGDAGTQGAVTQTNDDGAPSSSGTNEGPADPSETSSRPNAETPGTGTWSSDDAPAASTGKRSYTALEISQATAKALQYNFVSRRKDASTEAQSQTASPDTATVSETARRLAAKMAEDAQLTSLLSTLFKAPTSILLPFSPAQSTTPPDDLISILYRQF